MTHRIKVIPGKPSAIGMAHPIDGSMKKDGSMWLEDQFTARRLTDGSIIRAPEAKVEGAETKAPDAAADEAKTKAFPALKAAVVDQKSGVASD